MSFGISLKGSDNVKVRSLESRQDDYTVARSLADSYKVGVNVPYTDGTQAPGLSYLTAAKAVDFWELSCGGCYLPIYPLDKASGRYGHQVSVGGDVCYGFAFFTGKARFNGNPKKIGNDIFTAFDRKDAGEQMADEFFSGLESTGAPVDSDACLQLYYASFRARFHGGRNSYKVHNGRLRLTPLISSKLLSASLSYRSSGCDDSHVIRSLYAAVDPNLAAHPFSGTQKNVSYHDVLSSPLVGVHIKGKSLRLYDGTSSLGEIRSSQDFLSSYMSESMSRKSTETTFKDELNDRMSVLVRDFGHAIPIKYKVDKAPVLSHDVMLSSGAREWTRLYFMYRLFSIL